MLTLRHACAAQPQAKIVLVVHSSVIINTITSIIIILHM